MHPDTSTANFFSFVKVFWNFSTIIWRWFRFQEDEKGKKKHKHKKKEKDDAVAAEEREKKKKKSRSKKTEVDELEDFLGGGASVKRDDRDYEEL